MRIKITDDTKKWLTVAELPQAKQIIKDFNGPEENAAEYIHSAAACWLHNSEKAQKYDGVVRVLSAEAEIAGNARAWNAYGNDTGRLDIWLTGTVETSDGFLKISCYLTDVWNIGPSEYNKTFPDFCYARYYTEKK